jgi:hypothetical protein
MEQSSFSVSNPFTTTTPGNHSPNPNGQNITNGIYANSLMQSPGISSGVPGQMNQVLSASPYGVSGYGVKGPNCMQQVTVPPGMGNPAQLMAGNPALMDPVLHQSLLQQYLALNSTLLTNPVLLANQLLMAQLLQQQIMSGANQGVGFPPLCNPYMNSMQGGGVGLPLGVPAVGNPPNINGGVGSNSCVPILIPDCPTPQNNNNQHYPVLSSPFLPMYNQTMDNSNQPNMNSVGHINAHDPNNQEVQAIPAKQVNVPQQSFNQNTHPPSVPSQPFVFKGAQTGVETPSREQKLQKYRKKREKRNFSLRPVDPERSKIAQARPRDENGQFLPGKLQKTDILDLQNKLDSSEHECNKLRDSLCKRDREVEEMKRQIAFLMAKNEQQERLQELPNDVHYIHNFKQKVQFLQQLENVISQRMARKTSEESHSSVPPNTPKPASPAQQIFQNKPASPAQQISENHIVVPPNTPKPASPAQQIFQNKPASPAQQIFQNSQEPVNEVVAVTPDPQTPASYDTVSNDPSPSFEQVVELNKESQQPQLPPEKNRNRTFSSKGDVGAYYLYYPYWKAAEVYPPFKEKIDFSKIQLRQLRPPPNYVEQSRTEYFEAQKQWEQHQEEVSHLDHLSSNYLNALSSCVPELTVKIDLQDQISRLRPTPRRQTHQDRIDQINKSPSEESLLSPSTNESNPLATELLSDMMVSSPPLSEVPGTPMSPLLDPELHDDFITSVWNTDK